MPCRGAVVRKLWCIQTIMKIEELSVWVRKIKSVAHCNVNKNKGVMAPHVQIPACERVRADVFT